MIAGEDSYENEKLKNTDDDLKLHRDQELDFTEKGLYLSNSHPLEKKKKVKAKPIEEDKRLIEDDEFFITDTDIGK